MELIISSSELQKELSRLFKKYNKYYWATAWAGVSSKFFEELNSKKDRIEKIVVGLHFYQTHPDFIENFISNKNVKFIKQTSGTFHPKVYLFFDNKGEGEALIGAMQNVSLNLKHTTRILFELNSVLFTFTSF